MACLLTTESTAYIASLGFLGFFLPGLNTDIGACIAYATYTNIEDIQIHGNSFDFHNSPMSLLGQCYSLWNLQMKKQSEGRARDTQPVTPRVAAPLGPLNPLLLLFPNPLCQAFDICAAYFTQNRTSHAVLTIPFVPLTLPVTRALSWNKNAEDVHIYIALFLMLYSD